MRFGDALIVQALSQLGWMTCNCCAELLPATVDVARGPFRSAADVDGPCISVTGVDGERVYCSMQASANGREHSLRSQYHGGQLTKDSMHILMELVSFKSYALHLIANLVALPVATQTFSLTCQPHAHIKPDNTAGNLSVSESKALRDLAR